MQNKHIIVFVNNFSDLAVLTLLMLENIPAFWANTMPADALAPKVTRASAGMVLAV